MGIRARLLKGCYAGHAGDEITLEHQKDFEYLRKMGYAALVEYETAAKVTPVRRTRGRPRKT